MNVSSTFKLNNGNEIPVIALGSWDSRGDEAYQACLMHYQQAIVI